MFVVLLMGTTALAGTAQASDPGAGLAVGSEIPSLRTADSKTFVGADGTRVARLYQGPVNYEDGSGAWQPIDNSLVSGPDGFTNAANRFQVQLPGMLGFAPVRLSDGSQWVSFSLDGASGVGVSVPSGSSATYASALRGVDVTYAVTGSGLNEYAVLAGPSSPQSFSYSVQTSSGLTAVQVPDGSIDFVDAAGESQFSFSPPRLSDAASADGVASYQLSPTKTGYIVTLDANSDWLNAPDRVWPVTIDPSLTDDTSSYTSTSLNPTADGYVSGGTNANNNFFGTLVYEKVGWSTTVARRTLQQFDVSGLPAGSQVLNAALKLYLPTTVPGTSVPGETSTTQASVGVYSATRAWTSSATWNKYNGTNSWTTAGGDFTGELAPQSSSTPWATTTVGGSLDQYYSWDVTQLAAGWANGTIPNKGLNVKYVNEATNSNVFSFISSRASSNKPYLAVTYDLGKGSWQFHSFDDFTIDDSTTASVNEGNGNLLVCQKDINLPGVAGFGLSLQHCWNSLGADPHAQGGWVMPGSATYLDAVGTSVVYHGETGVEVPFTPDGSGGYLRTVGFDAALTASTGTLSSCSSHAYAYIVSLNADGSKQYLNSAGQLVADADQNGNAVCFNYGSNVGPSSITDTGGRTISFSYDGSGRPVTISYSSSNCTSSTCTYTYAYTSGKLTSATDPTGATTNYGYDGSGNLTSVQDPRGNSTTVDYQTDSSGNLHVWKVTEPAHSSNPTVFTYNNTHSFCSTKSTDVTSPNGYTTDYCRDTGARITAVYTPDGATTKADYIDTTNGGSCVDSYGNSLDDQPCATRSGNGYWTTYGYDSTGQKHLWKQNPVQTSTNRSTWVYGDSSHPYYPTSATDAEGNTTSYTYTSSGNISTQQDALGNTTRYCYVSVCNADGTGELATQQTGFTTGLTCPSGTPTPICPTTSYVYSQGDLTERTDALGNISTFAYDGAGNQTSETDGLVYNSSTHTNVCPSGATCPVTSRTYDGVGRVLTETNPLSYTTQYTYDGDGNQTSETDGLSYNSSTHVYYCPSGSVCPATSDTYDANNQRLSATDPNSNTTYYTYDADGNQLTETDPDGNRTKYLYDVRDQQASVQSGLPSSGVCATGTTCPTTGYEYDWDGNQLTETDPLGYQTQYTYDTADELTSEISGTTYHYDPFYGESWYSCVSGDTCPGATFGYDYAGNQTSVIDGNGSETVTAYDADNRQQTVTSGYQYDSGGTHTYHCLSGRTCPQTTYTYDNNGNQATVTNPDGNQTLTLHNADNQAASATSGLNSSGACPTSPGTPVCPKTTYTYDNVGNTSTVTQAAESGTPTTSYAYFADGSVDTTTDPMLSVTIDSYDNVGNLVSEQTSAGTTTSCYDAGGELLSTYYSAATCGTGTPDVSYTYDVAGNQLTTSTTGTYGQTTETTVYTNLELPQSVATSEPISSSSTLTGTFQYIYDANREVTKRTYPDGTNVYYSFNNAGLECRVGSASSSTCSGGSPYVTYGYDADSNLNTSTHPSGSGNVVETRNYDNANRLSNVATTSGSNTIAAFAYTLDAAGNATTTARTGYDPSNNNWGLSCSMSGTPDNNERLASSTYSGCPTSNSDPSSYSWRYDADGNWTQDTAGSTTTTYTTNKADQICATSATGGNCSTPAFTYDGNGNETADGTSTKYAHTLDNKLCLVSSSSTATCGSTPSGYTAHTYDGDGNPLSQTTSSTGAYYFWDTNTDGAPQLALEENSSGTVTARYLYGMNRLSAYDGTTTKYYVYDGLGSVSNLVTSSGSVSSGSGGASYLYNPYGSIRYSTGGSADFSFAGLRSSAVSGVYSANARSYDTNTGRFLSQDPVGNSGQTAGTYVYGNDNPQVYTDPNGTASQAPLSDSRLQLPKGACRAYHYYRGRGLCPNAAAGIVGNLWAESGLNPRTVNEIGFIGIAQWDPSLRWPRFVSWVRSQPEYKANWGRLQWNRFVQVRYVLVEMKNYYSSTYRALKNPNITIKSATAWVMFNYEVPCTLEESKVPGSDCQKEFNKRKSFAWAVRRQCS